MLGSKMLGVDWLITLHGSQPWKQNNLDFNVFATSNESIHMF